MKLVLDYFTLADWDYPPLAGMNINGQILAQVEPIVRYVTRIFDRLNPVLNLSFTVRRTFDTVAAAEVFFGLHFSLMPRSGTLVMYCGNEVSNTPVYFPNAVVVGNPQTVLQGISVLVTYQIIAAVAYTDTPPGVLIDPTMIQAGLTDIDAAANSVDVEFTQPFSTAPVVVATVGVPSGGDLIWASVDQSTVTIAGFTARLSGPAPDANYKLNWEAKQVALP